MIKNNNNYCCILLNIVASVNSNIVYATLIFCFVFCSKNTISVVEGSSAVAKRFEFHMLFSVLISGNIKRTLFSVAVLSLDCRFEGNYGLSYSRL